jgi:hypothetical protein
VIALSPSKLISNPARPQSRGEWFRLARSSDGVLCLESITDETLHRPGEPAEWAFGAEVPRHIAKQLADDHDPDQVVKVLVRAMHILGYT